MKRLTRWLVASLLVVIPTSGCQTAPAATVERGEWMFRNYCSSCHLVDGSGDPKALAPAIAGLPQWYVERQVHGFRAGHRGADFDDIEGMRMRPMAMTLGTDVDISAVSMYVASLRPVQPPATLEGDATKGQASYQLCKTCHGAAGEGLEQMGGPPLTDTHDWYLATQLRKFKSKDRGAMPGDTYGAQMMPMAATLADEQAVNDVIAHILTLRK